MQNGFAELIFVLMCASLQFENISGATENIQRCEDMSKSTPHFCDAFSRICPTTCQKYQNMTFKSGRDLLQCGNKVPMKPTRKLKPKESSEKSKASIGSETQTVIVESNRASKRIIGGKESRRGEWPWQVVMRGDINKTHMTSCAGSIIASDIILSATHCIFPVENPRKWTVHIAMHDQRKDEPFEEKIKVKKIVKNEQFRTPRKMSDIALFQLEKRINFRQYNKEPICLPDPAQPIEESGQKCYISGWGRTSETGAKSRFIKHASVKTISREVCNKPRNYGGSVDETEFCAGRARGGKDTCEGDSGGTLACRIANRWYAAGIVSLGEGCGRPHKYGVYTNVSYFNNWIITSVFNKL